MEVHTRTHTHTHTHTHTRHQIANSYLNNNNLFLYVINNLKIIQIKNTHIKQVLTEIYVLNFGSTSLS